VALPAWLRSRTWPRFHDLLGRKQVRLSVATGVIACLGFAAFSETRTVTADAVATMDPLAAQAEIVKRAQSDRAASRSLDRAQAAAADTTKAAEVPATKAPAAAATQPPAAAQPPAAQPPAAAPPAKPKSPAQVAPVAGLSQVQMNNAQAIVKAGLKLGIPERGLIIAVATAMQESTLLNRASEVLPESKRYPHQGTGSDHDSVGLFQQRTSTGWGPVASLMQPEYAATKFYQGLLRVPGWQNMALTYAAQAVQVSAFPEAYAKHEAGATAIVKALLKAGVTAS
jgi:hypothetical protein